MENATLSAKEQTEAEREFQKQVQAEYRKKVTQVKNYIKENGIVATKLSIEAIKSNNGLVSATPYLSVREQLFAMEEAIRIHEETLKENGQ